MGDRGSFFLPESASTLAPTIDWLFNFVNWVSLIIFVIVVGSMVYLVVKYRRRHPNERTQLVKESKLLEASWIVIPTILVLLVFTWGFRAYVKVAVAPPDAYEIHATGFQWAWTFTYPEGFSVNNEMYVPVGRPVRLIMSSTDVLHSFFVPAFRIKQDVLPNRYSSVWFEATRVGEYDIFCTEYCGTSHAYMIGKVHVVDQNTFSDWVDSGGAGDLATLPLEEQGRLLVQRNGCLACHSLDGSSMTGPTFKALFGSQRATSAGSVVADENYLRESILMPGAKVVNGYPNVMPANYASLPAQQVDAMITYMKTLN